MECVDETIAFLPEKNTIWKHILPCHLNLTGLKAMLTSTLNKGQFATTEVLYSNLEGQNNIPSFQKTQ